MKLYKSWLLPATCTIILVVTTYATTIKAANQQKQAEVNTQQVAVSPSRSLKYGDKTTKKIPNQEILFLPPSPTTEKYNKNIVTEGLTAEKQHIARNRSRSRIEPTELATKQENPHRSRQKNQLYGQYEIPIVHKQRELSNNPITPTVGQHIMAISNRSRTPNSLAESRQQQPLPMQQPPLYFNSNVGTEKTIAQTKISTAATTHKSRQRKPATTSRSVPSVYTNQPPTLSSYNSNVRTHHIASSRNSTIVRHYHSNQRNNNNNNNIIISKTQPLLASSNAFSTSGLQSKTESRPPNKQTGNISDNKSVVSGNSTNSVRSIVRKFTSNPSPTTIAIISSTSATSTSTTTTTTTTSIRPQFQLPNAFNIFAPQFWQFLYPNSSPLSRIQATTTASTPTTSTRKPPKKYKPPTHTSTKEEKVNLKKPKPTILPRTTSKKPEFDSNRNNNNNNNNQIKDEGPFRIALPTLNILNSKRETHDQVEKGKRNVEKVTNLRERFNCPRESEVRFQLFPKICKIDDDCEVWDREEICCDIFGSKSCVSGIPKPLEETSHAPILGVIPRKCPNRPLAELWWEVKECDNDMDCWPRVCCPDGRRRYCRTSQPELNTVPVPVQRSFNYLSEYLECTAPPPPIFDLHPKLCTSTLDCFPNVCCQEAGQRHCRPPKKSVLTMLANVFNVDFVKRLTQNIVIK